jgi:hypothetical protein
VLGDDAGNVVSIGASAGPIIEQQAAAVAYT